MFDLLTMCAIKLNAPNVGVALNVFDTVFDGVAETVREGVMEAV